jgi:uncharacterized C2H2 Zn-finger protein
MRKINEEQFKKLEFKQYKGESTELFANLRKLEVGEHLFLGKDEWKLNSDPVSLVSNSQHRLKGLLVGYRFSIKQLADNLGWIITRRVNLNEAPEVDTGYRCSICKEMFESRKSARQHLAQTHVGEFGRVMYIKSGTRKPSERWLKYKNGKSFLNLFRKS